MTIICCFETLRPEFEGSAFLIYFLNDYKNLEYFMTTKTLSCRQARWSMYRSRFNFKIVYQLGKMNGKADALTHQSDDLFTDEDEQVLQQSRLVLKLGNFLEVHTSNIPFDPTLDEPISEPALTKINNNDFQQLESDVIQPTPLLSPEQAEVSFDENDLVNPDELWKLAYANLKDPIYEVISLLLQNHRWHPIFRKLHPSMADCQLKHGPLFYCNRMYIFDHHELCLHLIQQAHNSSSGHMAASHVLLRYFRAIIFAMA